MPKPLLLALTIYIDIVCIYVYIYIKFKGFLFDRKFQHSKECPILIPYAQVIRVQSLSIDDPKSSLEPDVKVMDILKDSICHYCTRF